MAERDERGRWIAGQSANPGGVPKEEREIRALCKKMAGGAAPDLMARLIDIGLNSPDERAALQAIKLVLEFFGVPKDSFDAIETSNKLVELIRDYHAAKAGAVDAIAEEVEEVE